MSRHLPQAEGDRGAARGRGGRGEEPQGGPWRVRKPRVPPSGSWVTPSALQLRRRPAGAATPPPSVLEAQWVRGEERVPEGLPPPKGPSPASSGGRAGRSPRRRGPCPSSRATGGGGPRAQGSCPGPQPRSGRPWGREGHCRVWHPWDPGWGLRCLRGAPPSALSPCCCRASGRWPPRPHRDGRCDETLRPQGSNGSETTCRSWGGPVLLAPLNSW